MSAFRRFFSFQSGLRKGLAATLAALLVLALFGASGPAAAITVVKTGTPGPYSFSTSQTSGQAGTCSYTDGALNKISVVSPLAAERAFWTVPHNGVVTNGQFVHYIQRLYGLKGSTWTLLRTESVEVLVHASLTRMPTLAAFTPKNGMIAGYYTFRVTEELRWVNPIVGGIEGTAKITLATYWDGHAWLVNCHVAPTPVYKVGAIPTDSSVKLQWSNPSSAYFAGVVICTLQGKIYPSSRTSTCRTVTKPNQTTTFSPRLPNTTYSVVLWAYDVFKHYSIRKTAQITTRPLPGPVTGLQVTNVATGVSLSWTKPTSLDFTGVKICRVPGSTPTTNSSCVGLTPGPSGTTANYVDTTAPASSTFSYSVFAHDATPTYVAAATKTIYTTPPISPPAPTLNADGTVRLDWTNPVDANVTGVKICRVTGATPTTNTACTALKDVLQSDVPNNQYTDATAQPGTTYSYSLWAHESTPFYSAISSVTVSTIPDAISPITPTLNADGTVKLDWTYPSSPSDPNVTSMKICRVEGSDATTDTACVAQGTVNRSDPQTFTDLLGQPGHTYAYSVWAFDGSYSAIQTITVTTAPPPVTDLTADASTAGQISLSWTTPSNPTYSVRICRADDTTVSPSNPTTCTVVSDPATSPFVDTNVVAGTSYTYAVWVRDGAGTYSVLVDIPGGVVAT